MHQLSKKRTCALLDWAAETWAQKAQEAINGPVRTVPSTATLRVTLPLQIILIPHLCFTLQSLQINFKSHLICTYGNRAGIVGFFSVLYVRKDSKRLNDFPTATRTPILIRTPEVFALLTKCKCAPWIPGRIR